MPVEINLHAGALAGAVIGYKYVLPKIFLKSILRDDLDRIGRPTTDNMRCNLAIYQRQIVAT